MTLPTRSAGRFLRQRRVALSPLENVRLYVTGLTRVAGSLFLVVMRLCR